MPEEAKDFWDLEHLLNECARPSAFKGRIAAKEKLLTALGRLHDMSEEHMKSPKIDPKGVPKIKPKKELWEYDDYDDTVVDGKAGDLEVQERGQSLEDQVVEEARKGAVVVE